MSRRKIKFSSEDLGPGSEARKIIKKYQSKGLQENLLNSDGKLQPQITQFFSKGKKEEKKADREVEPMEEEKASPNEKLEEEKKTITLTISDSDSETSYYSDKQEKSEKATPVKKVVPVKKASPPPSPRRTLRDMPNVVFYKNLAASRPQGDYIEKIHRYWKGDFKKLEIHHGFVQWLFPNYYSSGYNKDSFPLKPDEAMIFRGDKEIAERLVKSYEMMLEFYGMKLVDKKTGKLQRASNYEIRYKNALMTNLHNHLRIKRILAHLSIVGFRQYAIELVNFLEVEIYGEKGGHKKYLEQKKPLSLDYLKTINKNPLFPLVRHDIFKDWSIYGETKTDTELNLLMMHAQVTDQKDFDPSILLRSK